MKERISERSPGLWASTQAQMAFVRGYQARGADRVLPPDFSFSGGAYIEPAKITVR